LAGDRRAVENRTGGRLGDATETGRMQKRQDKKQTGSLQDRVFTGAELQSDSGQEAGGGKNKSVKWLEYLSHAKI